MGTMEPTGGDGERMLAVEARLRTEIADIDALLTTHIATALALAPPAAVSLDHAVSLVGTFSQETGIVADAVLGSRQALGFADGTPVNLGNAMFWLHHSFSDSDGATGAPDSFEDDLVARRREAFENGGAYDFASSFHEMDEDDWFDSISTAALLNEMPGNPSFAGGGAILGPDNQMYPIMIPLYRPDGEEGQTYTAGQYNSNARTLGGIDTDWHLIGYETGTARFNDEPGFFEKFFVGGYTWSGGKVSAGPSNAALPYLEFDPRAQPRGNVTEPGMDLSSLDPGGLDIKRYDWVGSNGQRVRVENPVATGKANFRGNVLSLVAAGGHAWHVVGNLDGGRVRAYEVHFEYNPTEGTRRATVTSFQPVGDGSELQPAHNYIDGNGNMREIPANYLPPDGDSVSPGSLVRITEWGDPDIGPIGPGHGSAIDVRGPDS